MVASFSPPSPAPATSPSTLPFPNGFSSPPRQSAAGHRVGQEFLRRQYAPHYRPPFRPPSLEPPDARRLVVFSSRRPQTMGYPADSSAQSMDAGLRRAPGDGLSRSDRGDTCTPSLSLPHHGMPSPCHQASPSGHGIDIAYSPTPAGLIVAFETAAEAPLKVRLSFRQEFSVESAGNLLHGRTTDNSGGVPEGFALSFCGRFSEQPRHVHHLANGVCWEFAPGTRRVELRLAASFIDGTIARYALASQLDGRSFPEIEGAAGQTWETLLSRLDFPEPEEALRRTFYSCLYRTLLFPRLLTESDPSAMPSTTAPTTAQSIPDSSAPTMASGTHTARSTLSSPTPIPSSSRSFLRAGSTPASRRAGRPSGRARGSRIA